MENSDKLQNTDNDENVKKVKEVRLEIRIDENYEKMLLECKEALGVSKAEVIRKGIEWVHMFVVAEKKALVSLNNRRKDTTTIEKANKEAAERIRAETYKKAYQDAIDENYPKLLAEYRDRYKAEGVAKYRAGEEATKTAEEYVKHFMETGRMVGYERVTHFDF